CSAETARSAGARKQVNDMNKHRHLPHLSLLVGFLMMTATAAARQSAAAGQSNTAGSPFNTTFGPFNTTSSPFNTASSPFSATAGQIKTAKPGEPVERQLSGDQKFREWSLDANVADDIKRIKVCRVEDVCKMRFKEGETPRMRVRNLVVPLRYEDENIPINEAFTRQVQQAVDNLRDRQGVTVRFIGYTDDVEEMVTRVYEPAWGTIATLELANGQPIIPTGYAANLRRALTDISDRRNARLRFIGYTKNERLDRRTASVYVDDIGLSAARARRTMDIVMQDPVLSGARFEHEGRGYVQSDDVVNAGFTQGQESLVRVQVVYDEPLPLENYEGVDITRLTQEVRPKSPYDLNVMHITVDGKPIDDLGFAQWQPAAKTLAGPARELKYLLRAYDSKGNFDETGAHPLWLYREPSPNQIGKLVTSDASSPRELLAAYGESDLARHQIPLGSGTVTVQGSGIPTDHTVWVAGRQIPIDPQGNFVAERILPDGTHTVEVAVLDDAGNGSLYLRDLEFKRRDLFYVGVADLTLSGNRTRGPVGLLQGANAPQPYDSSLDGRL